MKSSEELSSEIFSALYQQDRKGFELAIIGGAIKGVTPAYLRAARSICSPTGGRDFHFNRDFSCRLRNTLFAAWRLHLDSLGPSWASGYTEPVWEKMDILCRVIMTRHPDMVGEEDFDELRSIFLEATHTPKEMMAFVCVPKIVSLWLQGERVGKELKKASASGDFRRKPGALIRKLIEVNSDVRVGEEAVSKSVFNFDEIPLSTKDSLERLSSGMPLLDRALGGGFRKSCAYLFLAFTGVGKTTFGIQMASTFSIPQDKKGLFFTTEENATGIKQRIISHCCRLPWEDLTTRPDLFRLENLDPKKREAYKEMAAQLSKNLQIIDWSNEENVSLSIEETVDNFTACKGQPPDYIILDWLGGALDHLSRDTKVRGDDVRHVYDAAAEEIRKCCIKHNLAGIYMAQTNRKGSDKMLVSVDDMGESFGPSKGTAAVIGMSAIRNREIDESGATATLYNENQVLYVSKARYGRGGAVPFKRNFGYQRLEPVNK
jgi:hypothetical protein